MWTHGNRRCWSSFKDCLRSNWQVALHIYSMVLLTALRGTIISFHGGYHGHSAGALGLMGNLSAKASLMNHGIGTHFFPYPRNFVMKCTILFYLCHFHLAMPVWFGRRRRSSHEFQIHRKYTRWRWKWYYETRRCVWCSIPLLTLFSLYSRSRSRRRWSSSSTFSMA